MDDDNELGSFIRTHIGSLLLSVLILIFILIILAGVAFSIDPLGFAKFLAPFLAGQGEIITQLPPESEAKLIELGYDPAIIAAGIESQNWVNQTYGVLIDLGIYQAIYELEWDEGNNPGTWGAVNRACAYSAQECEAAKWLLNHMKEKGVKSPYLSDDYSDYRGAGAGEFGPGLLPSTAKKICLGLQEHPDPTIKSCDFFDPDGAASTAVFWWLKELGYKFDLTDEQKFNELWGWNHGVQTRKDLINRAKKVNEELSSINLTVDSFQFNFASPDWWKRPVIWLLKLLNIWPDWLDFDPGDGDSGISPEPGDEHFAMIYHGGYTIVGGIHGQSYGHCAIDVVKGKGSEVHSPINGKVTQRYTDGLGNPVLRIENSQYVVELLHGKWDVRKGQNVVIDQIVGTESNMGNTWSADSRGNPIYCGTGSNCGFHTHFHALEKGGKCVNPKSLVNWPERENRRR